MLERSSIFYSKIRTSCVNKVLDSNHECKYELLITLLMRAQHLRLNTNNNQTRLHHLPPSIKVCISIGHCRSSIVAINVYFFSYNIRYSFNDACLHSSYLFCFNIIYRNFPFNLDSFFPFVIF